MARLLEHAQHPFDGAMNMAVDQAILESVDSSGVPCLRFYGWKNPTLSLGYFQKNLNRQFHFTSRELPIVRRSTGGGAIVHDRELTYSLCFPEAKSKRGANSEIYRHVHESIRLAFAAKNIHVRRHADTYTAGSCSDQAFLCFERRTDEDLTLAGYKICGSAQRRFGSALLQHGSILLAASRYAPSLPGVECLSGQKIDANEFCLTLATHLQRRLGLSIQSCKLTEEEVDAAETIFDNRFNNHGWNTRR